MGNPFLSPTPAAVFFQAGLAEGGECFEEFGHLVAA